MLLIDFFETHYKKRRLFGKSKETVRLYRISINSFGKTLGRRPTLADLTNDNVMEHMQRVIDNGRSPATANKDRSQLLTLWRFACQLKMVADWPDVPELKEPERTPEAWLDHEARKIFEVISKEKGHFDSVPRSLWWRTLLLIFIDTGERVGAVSETEWQWMKGEYINFPAEARKGKRRDRMYKLSPGTLESIDELRIVSRDRVKMFPFPYSEGYLWTLYKKLIEKAGLPHGRRDAFHKWRRVHASVVYAAGMDPQEALDHNQRRTTLRYLDPRFLREKAPCDALAEYLKNPRKPPNPDRKTG